MADHAEFWLAIAAAAPIIGLASAVTAEQNIVRLERNVELAGEGKQLLQGHRRLVWTSTILNLVLQAGALGLALYSLGVRELGVRLPAACLVIAGLLLVFLPTWTTTVRVYADYKKLKRGDRNVPAVRTKPGWYVNWI
jgi:hypothetical protein